MESLGVGSSHEPIGGLDEFHEEVRLAMDLLRRIEAIDLSEKNAKARATKVADKKRKPLQERFDAIMGRVMAYVRLKHSGVLKGGDMHEFETEELIVRFHKDGNGSLKILDEAAFMAYLESHPELRQFIKVEKSLTGAAKFKQWMRAHPRHRPPALIVYKNSIIFLRKQTVAEKRRGKEPMVLQRTIN